jgi:hypothetical protein
MVASSCEVAVPINPFTYWTGKTEPMQALFGNFPDFTFLRELPLAAAALRAFQVLV